MADGREGELLLRQLVSASYRFKDAHLLAGRRIPSKRQGRRREIDLIVCTPWMIHLIEVKNWSGQLTVRDGVWRQTRRGGEVVDHGDLIRENRLRRDAVVEYLNGRGIALDERFVREHIVSQVIFTNPRLEQFCLASESRLAGVLSQGHHERMPSDACERIVACLSDTETWDQLRFFGTKVVTGDVVSLRVGSRIYRKPELMDVSGNLPIRLKWTRGRFWGLFKAVTGLGPLGSLHLGKARMDVSPGDTVMFHAVGDREPSAFKLVEADRILLG